MNHLTEYYKRRASKTPSVGHTYDRDMWKLIVYIGDKIYEYSEVSPYHVTTWLKELKSNFGTGMAYLKQFAMVRLESKVDGD